MGSPNYPIPEGLYAIPHHLLDLRPDFEIDCDLLDPKPVTSVKNVWFFWDKGFARMHPYAQRNVRAWHRRLSKLGWTVRVLDREPSSALNVAKFLDPSSFPKAFVEGTIGGLYAAQHTSDLVRWPLLLKFGGVYADVGLIQIGDLDRLWNETLADPQSPFEVLSYNYEGSGLANYFLGSRPGNALFARCHRLLLELWGADGGRTSTEGMHSSPLLKGLPMMRAGDISFEENGETISSDEARRMLTDYIIQGQVTTMVMGLVDEEDGWDGLRYIAERVYAVDYMEGSQLINHLTRWDGPRQYALMSGSVPRAGEAESADQKQAREIVEACLQRSFGFKLAHGFILRVYGDTLGSLWRAHAGSDDVPGTYAHWLRHGTVYWNQSRVPPRMEFDIMEPFKRGPLLREA